METVSNIEEAATKRQERAAAEAMQMAKKGVQYHFIAEHLNSLQFKTTTGKDFDKSSVSVLLRKNNYHRRHVTPATPKTAKSESVVLQRLKAVKQILGLTDLSAEDRIIHVQLILEKI